MNRPIREDPRISVNKLGDYLVANAGRRRRILEEQKRPASYQVNYYEEAVDTMRLFYAQGMDETIIQQKIDELDQRIPGTDFEEQKTRGCLEALEAFLELSGELDLSEYEVTLGDPRPARLVVGNVAISVRPELLLYKGEALVGAVKFHVGKGTVLSPEHADYVGTTVHQYIEEVLGGEELRQRDIYVVDLFRSRVRRAPQSYRRRRQDIQAACEEIAARWPTI